MYFFLKRAADILFSILGIILSAPILILCIVLLFLTGETSPIFTTYRVGKKGALFRMFKLRTMASAKGKSVSPLTAYNDSRVSFLGRILRFTKVDELPQFFNILNGDLSFVGPRPMLPQVFLMYDKNTQDILNQIRPGVTGIGSIVFRNETALFAKVSKRDYEQFYRENIAPVKGELELWYFSNRSFKVDFKLLVLTVVAVFYGQVKGLHRYFKGLPKTWVIGA